MKHKISYRGFTLVELLVVIAIIGILSSLAIVSLNDARVKARDAKRQSDINSVYTALQVYFDNNGSYPVCACVSGNATPECFEGSLANSLLNEGGRPYISPVPSDPKNDDTYYYTYCSDNGKEFLVDYLLEAEEEPIVVRGF